MTGGLHPAVTQERIEEIALAIERFIEPRSGTPLVESIATAFPRTVVIQYAEYYLPHRLLALKRALESLHVADEYFVDLDPVGLSDQRRQVFDVNVSELVQGDLHHVWSYCMGSTSEPLSHFLYGRQDGEISISSGPEEFLDILFNDDLLGVVEEIEGQGDDERSRLASRQGYERPKLFYLNDWVYERSGRAPPVW